MREYVYRPVVRLALIATRLLGIRFDLQGLENLPAEGGAVLAANHVSFLDFIFVGLAYHRRNRRLVRFLAKRSVFERWPVGWLLRSMRHIPVDRAAGAGAYGAAVEALRAGEVVGVFPESTISRSFLPRQLKSGAARMAAEAGVPLIPVATWGGQRLWTAGRRPALVRRVPVTVLVDPPLSVGAGEEPDAVTRRLTARLAEMVDGVIAAYPDREAGGGAWWMPARMGGTAPTPEEADGAERRAIAGRTPVPPPAG
ncbi:MAG: lysophospholipid acyltransferase family protein [Actinomycetota bacterium]|jgi:1-acyl-sn-glycerol-3-phosphate acyltransferase|nr:lysophospholipid acyltransferase family protein [Actinomycetota bacterium]